MILVNNDTFINNNKTQSGSTLSLDNWGVSFVTMDACEKCTIVLDIIGLGAMCLR